MAVVSLCEYRNRRTEAPPAEEAIPRPRISDTQIWARDYGKPEQMLGGLFKVREILNYHLHHEEEWKHYLLVILDALFRKGADSSETMGRHLGRLMNYLAMVFDAENRKDLGAAIIILDLVSRARDRALSS